MTPFGRKGSPVMEKKRRQLIIWSFAWVIILCVIVFAWLSTFMTGKTRESVTDIGVIYISEINEQIQQKFQTIVNLCLEQVDTLMKTSLSEAEGYDEDFLENLRDGAGFTSFTYLGFYKEDGALETIYGDEIVFEGEDDVETLLDSYGSVIKRGIDSNGDMLFLFGRAAEYELEDGSKTIALLAGVPMEDMNDALYLYTEGANAYSHIIDMDGDYVIRNADFEADNYFERIENEFETLDGKTSEVYEAELRAAMENGEDYGTRISVDGEERYIYCTPIATKSTWYLITVMPEGVIKETMTELDQLRITVIIGAMLIILGNMVIVFLLYARMSRRNLRDLDAARKEAIHANRAKSDFLSSMSHDIRTPMNAIMGMTDIALDNQQDPARVEDCLKKIKLSGRHLLGLINDVLDMSKIESGKMSINWEHVSLRETIDDVVSIVQPQIQTKKQHFDVVVRDVISEEVVCDGTRLSQILLNLLSNALKFTPEGGRIGMHMWQEASPAGDGLIRTHFIVEDTGIGMSKEFQDTLYDTFTREKTDEVEKTEGSGLGMAITKAIVEAFGGTIELKSEQGKGSRFHVALDFRRAGINTSEPKPESGRTDFTGKRILLAEDIEINREVAAEILKTFGIISEYAENGKECVEQFEKSPIGYYDAIFMDLQMPVMNGYEATKAIRALNREDHDLPVIAMTANAFSSDIQACLDVGMDAHLAKPLDRKAILAALQKYL